MWFLFFCVCCFLNLRRPPISTHTHTLFPSTPLFRSDPGVLAIRYPMQDRQIQNGAQLTVREGQIAAFINEGQVADVLGPGLYTIDTANLPVLTSLMNW